ncbi:MAG: MFS transporter, partial [Pacificimonas sp.]
RRKSWLILAQASLGAILIVLSTLDPKSALGWFSLLAGFGAFASATQDIVIDAWRVDVADEIATLDLLSTVYQFGYRIASLAGGALALVLAARIGWPNVYMVFGFAMLGVLLITFFAPDTPRPVGGEDEQTELRSPGAVHPRIRGFALAAVGSLWAWALITVGVFMVRSLTAEPELRPNPTEFIQFYGPLIIVATVIIPTIIAAWLETKRANGQYVMTETIPATSGLGRTLDHGYAALILPLGEIAVRLRWASVLVLALILSYRITDSIWGPFAYPFYLGELGYTNDEVALASKFFGVGMTMLGIALSAFLFASIGRMATVVLGAIIAAASNLLYADLAAGGGGLDIFGTYSGFYQLVGLFGADERLARLMLAISGENIAGGIAGAAFIAYLSAITSKKYSAVQYALLSSLTFLVGSLGRAALGEGIERIGYESIFYITAAIGVVAVILAFLELLRERANNYRTVAQPA